MGPPGNAMGPPGNAMGPPGNAMGPPGNAMGPPGNAMGPPKERKAGPGANARPHDPYAPTPGFGANAGPEDRAGYRAPEDNAGPDDNADSEPKTNPELCGLDECAFDEYLEERESFDRMFRKSGPSDGPSENPDDPFGP